MPQTSRDLVAYKSYTPTGTTDTKQTRKLTLDQEWVFGGTGGTNLMIKFDSNFFKKHLFTYSKKTAEVAQNAYLLSKAAGDPPGRELEFWLQAELTKLNQKLRKALEHRAERYKCTCGHYQVSHKCTNANCKHEEIKHKTGTGNPCPCKVTLQQPPPAHLCGCANQVFHCDIPACPCTAFNVNPAAVGIYAAQRAASGKGPDNPLAGAATQLNTCIILDRIPMEKFKSVVINSFETAETPAFTWAINDQKDLTWDFAVPNCIINASLGQDPGAWTSGTQTQVVAQKISTTPALNTYKIVHLAG